MPAIPAGTRTGRGSGSSPSGRRTDRTGSGRTVCPLIGAAGLTIDVAGLDAIDGTPVLDVKPYLTGFAPRGEVREPAWAAELMADYW